MRVFENMTAFPKLIDPYAYTLQLLLSWFPITRLSLTAMRTLTRDWRSQVVNFQHCKLMFKGPHCFFALFSHDRNCLLLLSSQETFNYTCRLLPWSGWIDPMMSSLSKPGVSQTRKCLVMSTHRLV